MFKIILSPDTPSRKIRLLKNWGSAKLQFRRGSTTVIEQCTNISTLCTTTFRTIYNMADGECPVSSGTGTSAVISWSGPRTVIVPRTEAGFGFTLRHFIVYPPESSISAQIQDGETIVDENDPEVRRHKRTKLSDLEPMDTIFVKHVKDESPADKAGLNPGDRIVSVNGELVNSKTYSQVIGLIQSSDSSLKLLVVPKNEDILQMAYQNTAYNQAGPEIFPDPVSGLSSKHIKQYLPKDPPVYLSEPAKDRKVSFTFEETHSLDPIYTTTTIREIIPRPLVTSASYTSGICLQREPLKHDNMNKSSFLDRKREFELRASQVPEGKIDSYSFGLYYPPQKKDPQKSNSIDNIYITSSSRRRTSRENVLQSREFMENVSRSVSHFQTAYNGKESGQGFSTTPRSMSSENKQFPRSRTTSSLSSIANTIPQDSLRIELSPSDHSNSSSCGVNSSVSSYESSTLGKTHYIPVHATQTPLAPRSLQIAPNNRGSQYSHQTSESHNKWPQSAKQEKSELTSLTHGQLVFKPTYGTPAGNRNSSTSTPVLPNTYCNRPLVVQRKQQFETTSSNSSNCSSGTATPNSGTATPNSGCSATIMTSTVCVVTPKMLLPQTNRYRTEIEKITSRAKFESVASRAAQFETKSSLEPVKITPPVFTPPAKIHRGSTTERTPELSSKYQQSSERTSTYKAFLAKSLSTPTSPSQENLPVQSDKLMDTYCRYDSTPTVNYSRECYPDETSMSSSEGKDFKLMSKANYIATVNAAINNSDSSLLGMSSCTDSKDDFFSSANYEGSDVVILRKKTDATTPEHDAVKLQRRTSYLMATARERTELSLPVQHPLDRLNPATHALDPMRILTPGGHSQIIHSKKPKPATLLEERSTPPSIAEEQQQHHPHHPAKTELPPQPPSPQFESPKEGNLSCKSAIIDGKRSSDRSWKTYLVLLKGRELYLQDKRKEGNASTQFLAEMEQPVSIKGSSVDVATDYTKKKYVFRLTTQNGSEFLFQADDSDNMMSWIQAIKTNGELDDVFKIGDTEVTPAPNTKSSPQMPSKSSKKLSGLSFRPKITHSPNSRRRKTNEEGSKTKSWKGKLDRFKKKGNNTAPVEKPSGCFGIPLQICIQSPYKEGVPFMVDLCTRIVEARGLEVVGVYRVPGNKLAISMMQEELNRGIDCINLDNEKWLDINVISSLLKGFFRKLPDPLVTNELYPRFIIANQIETSQKRMLTLKRLLHQLPDNHFETFRHLALHLRKVADHSSINKMGARNLAIVLGPTLIRRSDEDVQGMAVDMSHQCRIIERIILHPDWFFSSWDEDCHVPAEENGAAESIPCNTPSPVTSSLASPDGDSIEEVEEINPRDILEEMIAATHRKMQGLDKKSLDEVDAPIPPTAQYEERDIDAEVAKHQAKIQASLTDLNSNGSQSQLDTISYSSRVTSERKASASSSSIGNDDLMDSTFLSKVHGSSQEIRCHLSRHYSNESLIEKSDELEISHGLNHTHSLSQDTLDSLRALRELDAQHQRESEQRRMESKKIDQEYLRTKEEIEMEDQHSIEDLLNPKKCILSSYTGGYSLSSTPYSTLFDGIDSVFQQPISGKGWLTLSPSTSSTKANEAFGGKYFVSVGNTKPSDKRAYHPAGLDSNKRSNSLEAILDATQPWCSSSNSRKFCDTDGSLLQESDLCVGLGSSLRRGSLDSMIDFYDKHENRLSCASTDSEDGSDLLTSLTTTFDQKLKILLNPSKYKLNGNSRPRCTASSVLPSISPSPLASLTPPTLALSPAPTTMSRYTDAGPISIVNDVTGEERDFNGDSHAESKRMLNLGLAYSWQAKKNSEMFDSFRDPSLHRSQKSETKIGIASRFTRSNSNPAPHVPGERAIITHGAAPIAASHLASSEFAQRRNNGTNISADGRVRYLSSITDTPSMPKDYYLRKKNLKTFYDKGSSLGPGSGDNSNVGGNKTGFSVLMARDLVTKADVNPLLSSTVGKASTNEKQRSTSPPPAVPRRKVRGRRRHTVGGSEDMKHYNTLVTLLSAQEDSDRVLSAWERLRPFSKASEMYEQLPIAWLNKNCQQSSASELDYHVQPLLERSLRKV